MQGFGQQGLLNPMAQKRPELGQFSQIGNPMANMAQGMVHGMVQKKSAMPGINSQYMQAGATNSLNIAKNPQAGTPSGARSFLGSGGKANGWLNTRRKVLGQN